MGRRRALPIDAAPHSIVAKPEWLFACAALPLFPCRSGMPRSRRHTRSSSALRVQQTMTMRRKKRRRARMMMSRPAVLPCILTAAALTSCRTL